MAAHRIVPNLTSTNPSRSQDFYTQVLGLHVAMDLGWIVTFADSRNRAVQLSVITQDQTAPVTPAVSIEVDDVDAVHAAAVNAGYEIVHPLTDEPWGVRRFFVRDPNGAVLNILSHRS